VSAPTTKHVICTGRQQQLLWL